MNVVVCVKQVPDTTDVRIDPETNTLIRAGVPSILNPDDAHATEAAVQLKERYGGTVTALCMGPPQAVEVLQRCIALGCDRGILLSDRAFAGSDTLATSYVLATAIFRLISESPVDLVLCGKQAIDGDTAQVGAGLAQRLDFAQLTYVTGVDEIDLSTRRMRVRRRLESGIETVESALPALLTCVAEYSEVRYASLPNMIRAARYQPVVWTAETIGAEKAHLGLKGSPTTVSNIFSPPPRPPGKILAGPEVDPRLAAAAVIDQIVIAAQTLTRQAG